MSCGCSRTRAPDSDGKTRLKADSAELFFRYDEESLKALKPKVGEKEREREREKKNFYLSTSLSGWGMGSNTTAAAEQKPHEVPNGWMKKLPAATAK